MTMPTPSSPRAPRQQLEHGDLMIEVEVGERLVQQIQARLLRQQRGNGQALALAAGERVHLAAAEAGEVHRRQRLARDALVLLPFPVPAAEVRMAADQRRLQHGRLEGIEVSLRQQAAQLGGAARIQRGIVLAAERNRAGLGLTQAGQCRQQRRLAGAVAAEDGHPLAGGEVEAEPGGDAHAADVDVEVADGEQGRHVALPRGLRVSR